MSFDIIVIIHQRANSKVIYGQTNTPKPSIISSSISITFYQKPTLNPRFSYTTCLSELLAAG